MICFLSNCNILNKKENETSKSIYVYKLEYNEQINTMDVTALALIKGKLYYYKKDSLLMTYKTLPTDKGRLITNTKTLELLKTAN